RRITSVVSLPAAPRLPTLTETAPPISPNSQLAQTRLAPTPLSECRLRFPWREASFGSVGRRHQEDSTDCSARAIFNNGFRCHPGCRPTPSPAPSMCRCQAQVSQISSDSKHSRKVSPRTVGIFPRPGFDASEGAWIGRVAESKTLHYFWARNPLVLLRHGKRGRSRFMVLGFHFHQPIGPDHP